jgi:iron(III) transport system permease protein
MARAGAFTFTLTLADPGPPLLLGLRRTLGYQMVLAATGDATFPALAALALIAVATVAGWRAGLRLWSGRDRAAAGRDDRPRPPASWRRACATSGFAVGFGAFALAAMFGLGMVAGETAAEGAGPRAIAADPAMTRLLVRSLALGLGAALLVVLSDWLLTRLETLAGRAAAGRFRRLAKAAAPPPIAAGVVVLALGRLTTLAAAAGWADAGSAAGWLNGDRAPLIATTLAVWLAVASPRVVRRPLGPNEADAPPDPRLDAAALAGVRRGTARRLARGGRLGEVWRDFAATLATAAVALAPAVLIASSTSIATVGPGVLLFRERGGSGAAVAATLGLVAWAVALATAPIGAERRRIASTAESPRA